MCEAGKPVSVMDGDRKFALGDLVTKTKGSSWTGRVVGFYSTALTPIGYAVESETETGSVQIYPESALAAAPQPNQSKVPTLTVETVRKLLDQYQLWTCTDADMYNVGADHFCAALVTKGNDNE